MKEPDAVQLCRQLLKPTNLNDLEEAVFRLSWQGLSYLQMSKRLGYDPGYIRGVGFQVWRNLSDACGERVTKKNVKSIFAQQFEQICLTAPVPLSLNSAISTMAQPAPAWGKLPGGQGLYGREAELKTLKQWILVEHRRCVSLIGAGGIGKTEMAAYLAQHLQGYFQTVLWYSLRTAPPLNQWLPEAIGAICRPTNVNADEGEPDDDLISELIRLLTERRCLLVLDNADTVLFSEDALARASTACAPYLDALVRASLAPHQSCILLTSRRIPAGLDPVCQAMPAVQTLQIKGLAPEPGRALVEDQGAFLGNPQDWQGLMQRVQGNPLGLTIAGAVIQTRFAGELAPFLQNTELRFSGIQDLLEQQFKTLSDLELQVMYWLAIEQQPTTLEALAADSLQPISQQDLFMALKQLHGRALICKQMTNFTQHSVVMEFCLDKLRQQVIQECLEDRPHYLKQYALTISTASQLVREIQRRIIIAPIAQELTKWIVCPERIQNKLTLTRSKLQQLSPQFRGYGISNLEQIAESLSLDIKDLKS